MLNPRSLVKSIEDTVISMCPAFQRCLYVFFFGLMFGISHYFVLSIFSNDNNSEFRWLQFAIAVWCIFNVIFNYVMAIRVDPGSPTDIPMSLLYPISHNCQKCGVIKPPRSHHCSICNRCIIQMDHHCPWIGSCVGHHNRRYFLNFLTYITLGLSEMLCLMSFQKQPLLYTLVLTLLICLGLFCLFHWFITLKGRTSLQICWEDPRYQPSSSILHNIFIVFGSSNLFVCLMPRIAILRSHGDRWTQLPDIRT